MPTTIVRWGRQLLGGLIVTGLAAGQGVWPAAAIDMGEAGGAKLRLARRGDRACVERCIGQCRAARAVCNGAGNSPAACRTQYQICARRCVVSCSSR
jgi:hypothetical protein